MDPHLKAARDMIPVLVMIEFELTVINKDKGTTETVNLTSVMSVPEWEKMYRPLTPAEIKSYQSRGRITAGKVTIVIMTI